MAIVTMGFPSATLDYWRDFLILDIISEVPPPRAPAKVVFRVNAGLWQMEIMWEKQRHKPPMTGNGKHTTYKNGDLGVGLWHCFTHIIGKWM